MSASVHSHELLVELHISTFLESDLVMCIKILQQYAL